MTPNNPPRFEQRRRLLAGAAAVGVASFAGLADALSAPQNKESLLIGLDGHSLRGMRWKASQLIDYACIEGLDAVLLNGLHYFESLELSHLRKLREMADTHGVKLYIGSGSIAAGSGQFRNTWGDAQQMLSRAIDVASVLGSAVVNVKIGSIEDRFLPGGIGPRIDEAIAVLKACQARAVDNGVKFGFENHAADLRSEELLTIVEEVGPDVCGVMIDPGNALWAMEDPMQHLERLAPYVVCNSLRDYVVWPSEVGAGFQWVALGEGMMDARKYISLLTEGRPQIPLFIETISHSERSIPFLETEHWRAYPDLPASEIVGFLRLIKSGSRPAAMPQPLPNGEDSAEQNQQKEEFWNSVSCLRRTIAT